LASLIVLGFIAFVNWDDAEQHAFLE